MQEAYVEARGFYDESSLRIDHPDVMYDHIGAELNFLAILIGKWKNEPDKKLYYADLAKRFLEEHLMGWIPQFCQDMGRAADSLFYRRLAEMTEVMIMTACHSYG